MLRTIRDPKNIDTLTKTASALTEIFNLWFGLMEDMKSVWAQSEVTIKTKTFESNTVALKGVVRRLLTDLPVPACVLKSHLLFDWEILDWLKRWKTLGCVDE